MLLKRIINNNKKILSNATYLSIIEIIRLIMPFLALPYIIKTIGTDNYGIIVFYQSIIAYFSIIINFGFDMVATREVSINRNNKDVLNKIVSSVLTAKLLLFILSFILLSILLFSANNLKQNFLLAYFCFFACVSDLIFPVWFFQGIEKMKIITIVRTLSILIYFIGIFLFIKAKSDYIYIPLLQSLGLVISAILGLWIMLKKERVKLIKSSFLEIKSIFKTSFHFFVSRASVVLNMNVAKTLAGIFLSMHTVAILDIAQKIASVSLIPINMLIQAIYPHNSKNQNKKYANKGFIVVIIISVIICILVFFFSDLAVKFLTKGLLMDAVPICKSFCIWIFLASISYYTGAPMLVAFGFPKPFNNSVILSTIFALLVYTILYLIKDITLLELVVVFIITELIVAVYRSFYCKKYKLFIKIK